MSGASAYASYVLVSAPNVDGQDGTYEILRSRLGEVATAFKFDLPTELKVGTLDALMQLSDDLAKADMVSEATVTKVVSALASLLDRNMEKLESNLTANGSPLDKYLESFQWNEAKYPIKSSIRELTDMIQKQLGQIDAELKSKMTEYTNLRQSVNNVERKQTGNLLVRSLVDLVSKDDFVLDSEYLVTLMVVVPKFAYKDWFAVYENGITEFVVPRSSRKITEDSEFGLFNVTLFKRVASDFKAAARERKFIVRDFDFNEKQIDAERQERSDLNEKLKKQMANILRWCKTNLSEAFIAWTHLKAVRVHAESILTYGLPVNYRAMLVKYNKKNERRVRDVLSQLYAHLGRADGSGADESIASTAVPGQNTEYYPYVSYTINMELIK